MTTLTTINGNKLRIDKSGSKQLVLSYAAVVDGKPCCCDRCYWEQKIEKQLPLPFRDCVPQTYFQHSVMIPTALRGQNAGTPVTVRIFGFVDDDLLIDGTIIEPGKYIYSGTCNGAHNVDHKFSTPATAFILALGDNFGVFASIFVTVRVWAGEDTEEPKKACENQETFIYEL